MRKKTGKEKINKIDKVDDMANCFCFVSQR